MPTTLLSFPPQATDLDTHEQQNPRTSGTPDSDAMLTTDNQRRHESIIDFCDSLNLRELQHGRHASLNAQAELTKFFCNRDEIRLTLSADGSRTFQAQQPISREWPNILAGFHRAPY
ncbi:hypothetical protein FRC11_012917 [Ceratobasidium sp. 423]|nr:hypothetical protein FRC11_012917 [Ceratobasidium sp. 423]